MLNQLRLKNVALITEAEISFSDGLNVLSGETGAGKSVILDSLNFVLGAKADKTMIRYGEQYCLVEATFSRLSDEVVNLLDGYDIESTDEIVIKRKFDINGNGYIKLNGENVTSTMLKKITSLLVDVHGQSDHFVLLSKTKQLDCIDQGANEGKLIANLKEICAEIKIIDDKLSKIGDPDERARRIDLLDYQINEITKSELKEGEEEELLTLRIKIRNAEKIRQALSDVCQVLSGENGCIDSVMTAEHSLRTITTVDEQYQQLSDRLNALRDEVDDIADTAKEYLDSFDDIDVDPDEIERRLDVYRNLKRKYGNTLKEIQQYLQSAIIERDQLSDSDEDVAKAVHQRERLIDDYYNKAVELSKARQVYAKDFSARVKEKLCDLGMPHAEFCVKFADIPIKEDITSYSVFGLDKVEFMFSANAGELVKPLSKIISGGEMSRFMLALKTQASSPCGTYIFDEIDAGISGTTASVVAKNFARIAIKKQVIAISHLPQISSMSDSSFLIEKTETDGKTFTSVIHLDKKSKVKEILRLIGGVENDDIAVRHAENMIVSAEEFKANIKEK